MRAVRRNITTTNERVDEALEQAENTSKFIEKCVLYYLDAVEKEYVTKEELEDIINGHTRKVEILNKNYLQVVGILEDLSRTLFQKGEEE